MKDLLGLRIRYVNSRIYDIRPELFGGQTFDLVFIGALLLHLRDPIGALIAARTVCHGELIATTPIIRGARDSEPLMKMYPVNNGAWWQPNKACFQRWFVDAAFRAVDVDLMVTLTADPADPLAGTTHGGSTQSLQLGRARP